MAVEKTPAFDWKAGFWAVGIDGDNYITACSAGGGISDYSQIFAVLLNENGMMTGGNVCGLVGAAIQGDNDLHPVRDSISCRFNRLQAIPDKRLLVMGRDENRVFHNGLKLVFDFIGFALMFIYSRTGSIDRQGLESVARALPLKIL